MGLQSLHFVESVIKFKKSKKTLSFFSFYQLGLYVIAVFTIIGSSRQRGKIIMSLMWERKKLCSSINKSTLGEKLENLILKTNQNWFIEKKRNCIRTTIFKWPSSFLYGGGVERVFRNRFRFLYSCTHTRL